MQTAAQGCSGSPARRDLTGVRAPQAPVWKGNWSVDYTPPLTDTLDGFAQVAGEYQSSLYYVAPIPRPSSRASRSSTCGWGCGRMTNAGT